MGTLTNTFRYYRAEKWQEKAFALLYAYLSTHEPKLLSQLTSNIDEAQELIESRHPDAWNDFLQTYRNQKSPTLGAKTLDVPYFSQLDNAENPYGSCNVTSFAMVFSFFEINPQPENQQLEDYLYRWLEEQGWDRHEPAHLVRMANIFGLPTRFTANATIQDIRDSIDNGKPCVIHGYWTRSGHICVCIGYTQNGLVFNDPYGQWKGGLGYADHAIGSAVEYKVSDLASYNVLWAENENDGNIWAHFFG